jgi:hypothetical protein
MMRGTLEGTADEELRERRGVRGLLEEKKVVDQIFKRNFINIVGDLAHLQ